MVTNRTRDLALLLSSRESVTGSPGEEAFGPFLADLLRASPAFEGHPEDVRLVDSLDDRRRRSIVFGLLRGVGKRTIILTGHYDVVGVDGYGSLKDKAFDPAALGPALVAELEGARDELQRRDLPPNPAETLALDDLRSGVFIAGRGLLDMKAGLAAGIAVLERFAAAPERVGNLLFMAVPDEEGSSHGMRSAVRLLPELLAEWGLEPALAINMDSAVDQGDGASARAVFMGSVGKSHPFVLFRGRPTHAGAPFDGVNPSLLSAEFVRLVESAPAVLGAAPDSGSEPPPPPTVLYHRDLRNYYDVTCPASVFVSLNVLTHDSSPREILTRVGDRALEAMLSALGLLARRAAEQSRRSGSPTSSRSGSPRVLTWSELAAKAAIRDRAAYEKARAALFNATEAVPALAVFVDACVDIAGLEGPLAITGLAPPWYPRAALAPEDAGIAQLVYETVAAFSKESGVEVALRPFFPGISDMSYLSPADAPEARVEAGAESPYGLDASPSPFRVPAINAGPWGRDYHQRLERLHAAYAFESLPELLWRLATAVLRGGE
jgi:arginine utilization protein RocB